MLRTLPYRSPKFILISLGAIFVVLTLVLGNRLPAEAAVTELVLIDSNPVTAEVVTSPEDTRRGLGGRCRLKEGYGMLFRFSNTVPSFWMKGMRFPIDIVWIMNDQVIGIDHDVQPDNGNRLYQPPIGTTAVLELPAGWAATHETSIGSQVLMAAR